MTPAARDAVTHEEMMTGLRRHLSADWGDVDEHDRQENELSLQRGFRLLSVYHTDADVTFWVLTEADRSHP